MVPFLVLTAPHPPSPSTPHSPPPTSTGGEGYIDICIDTYIYILCTFAHIHTTYVYTRTTYTYRDHHHLGWGTTKRWAIYIIMSTYLCVFFGQGQLSGGQKSKMMLGAAAWNKPHVTWTTKRNMEELRAGSRRVSLCSYNLISIILFQYFYTKIIWCPVSCYSDISILSGDAFVATKPNTTQRIAGTVAGHDTRVGQNQRRDFLYWHSGFDTDAERLEYDQSRYYQPINQPMKAWGLKQNADKRPWRPPADERRRKGCAREEYCGHPRSSRSPGSLGSFGHSRIGSYRCLSFGQPPI